ncbi:MAG: FG-GAP-like repeat-containing protein [bacterium]
MFHKNKKTILIASIGIILASFSTYLVILGYKTLNTIPTFATETSKAKAAGAEVQNDIQALPTSNLTDQGENYEITDSKANGPTIQVKKEGEEKITPAPEDNFVVDFPKEYSKKIQIKLDEQRSFSMTDSNGDGFNLNLFSTKQDIKTENPISQSDPLLQKENPKRQDILQYQDQQKRKSIYYTYQRDTQKQQRKVKNWIVYNNGNGTEKEQYSFENVKLKKNSNGDIEGFYFGQQDVKNEEVKAQVDSNLFERAKIALQKDEGADIEKGNKQPDFIIPRPYFVDAQKNKTNLDWELDSENSKISLNFSVQKSQYPLALDPTISFVAPGISSEGMTITGEASSYFGSSNDFYGRNYSAIAVADFNGDGKDDLVVGAYGYNSSLGRVYVFYGDNSVPTTAAGADVIINGVAGSAFFGDSVGVGDFNADGKNDLVIGYSQYSTYSGRVYILNGNGAGNFGTVACTGSSPLVCNSANANVIISGEATSNYFGSSFAVGDFNGDTKTDLAIGAYRFSGNTGRVYVFYSSRLTGASQILLSLASSVSNADVVLTGNANNDSFGSGLAAGDLNADGKTDLISSSPQSNPNYGYVYVFYNGAIVTKNATGADFVIAGESGIYEFGESILFSDLNNDGKLDLIASGGSVSGTGKIYIFYNDGVYPALSSAADFVITDAAVTDKDFAVKIVAGDFDGDGKKDLATYQYKWSGGSNVKIFYNDGSMPNNGDYADVMISAAPGDFGYFGLNMAVMDINNDGRVDLLCSTQWPSTGFVYAFYSNNGFKESGKVIKNSYVNDFATDGYFGRSLAAGDFNADGKTDLAVGMTLNGAGTSGRVYIFYNDGSMSNVSGGADVMISDVYASFNFGASIGAGDFNSDGNMDLLVTDQYYSSSTGRVYIFYNDGSYPTFNSAADLIIAGEATNNYFGASFAIGDFNGDIKTDLAVGAYGYNPGSMADAGRVYVFYNAPYQTLAANADAILTGEVINAGRFGYSLAAGDFNGDTKTDLAVGADYYNNGTNHGRVYIFHNGNVTTRNADTASAIIQGANSFNTFGARITAGDFNADGKTDLAVGDSGTNYLYLFYNNSGAYPATTAGANAYIYNFFISYSNVFAGDFNADGKTDLAVGYYGYNSNVGRVYLFYADGTNNFGTAVCSGTPSSCSANNGDVIIDGTIANGYFGGSFAAGDFNADGKNDLVVGGYGYSYPIGRVYIFNSKGSYPATSAGADFSISNTVNYDKFGYALAAGDFNGDSRVDLVVGSPGYAGSTGRVYFFYNSGKAPTSTNADTNITGENVGDFFGGALMTGDFNADTKTDLSVGAYGFSTNTGRAYVFNNDNNLPALAANADSIITGEAANNYFGNTLAVGDFNGDTKTDLAVGAYGFSTNTGRAYVFKSARLTSGSQVLLSLSNLSNADIIITGETTSNYLGSAFGVGDFDFDTKTDLAVGAYGFSTNTGRTYLFYSSTHLTSGSQLLLPLTTISNADANITGEATNNFFGAAFTVGDFNNDSRDDLVVGAYRYNNYNGNGRVYIFYNGTYPALAASASWLLTASSNFAFGGTLLAGDFNLDGKKDLLVGSERSQLRNDLWVYFNDGSLPTVGAQTYADMKFSGDAINGSAFGTAAVMSDFNGDGADDFAVGAYGSESVYYFITKNLKPEGILRGAARVRGAGRFR